PKLWGRRVGRLHTDHLDVRRPRCRRLGWLRRRLPSCDKRPCDRCRAEQRDELAPLHSITSSATLSNDDGTVRPSILAVWALMTNSNLVDWSTGRSAGLAPLRMRAVETPVWRYMSVRLAP